MIKSFIKGAYLSEINKDIDTFIQIKMSKNDSKIFFFDNNSLKYEQNFKFGSEIIIKDISKITNLKASTICRILNKIEFKDNILEDELVENEFFNDDNYKKVKKKLIYDIAYSRIQEISELLLFKNVNFKYFKDISKDIFFEFDSGYKFESLQEIYSKIFSLNGLLNVVFIEDISNENILNSANKLVHFGWKKRLYQFQNQKILNCKVF